MKCRHCSNPVDRNAWFCPACKRSVPRRRHGEIPVTPLIAVGAAAVIVAGGIFGYQAWSGRMSQPPQVEVAVSDQPVVEIRSSRVRAPEKPKEKPEDRTKKVEEKKPEEKSPEAEQTPEPEERTRPAPGGNGTLTVLTEPPVKTFVYLNGGSLLGEAPLRDAQIPAGQHTLVLWAPSIGGRSRRRIEVEAGKKVLVIENIDRKAQFASEADG